VISIERSQVLAWLVILVIFAVALTIKVDNGNMTITGDAVKLGSAIRAMPDVALDIVAFDSLYDNNIGGVAMNILNNGNASFPLKTTITVELYLDGTALLKQEVDISQIQPGKMMKWWYNLSKVKFSRYGNYLPPGTHKVLAKIDTKNKLKERDEKNNILLSDIIVLKACEKSVILKPQASSQAVVNNQSYMLYPLSIMADGVRFQVSQPQKALIRQVNFTRVGSYAIVPDMPKMFVYKSDGKTAMVGVVCT